MFQVSNDLLCFFGLDDLLLDRGHSTSDMSNVILNKNKYYVKFDVPKKNGGSRTINQPKGLLFDIQKKISILLYSIYKTSFSSHGFELNKNIKTNAIVHLKKNHLLNIDLKDFYNHISANMVLDSLKDVLNLSLNECQFISEVCCLNNSLPQGSPSSPILSNIVCYKLDEYLQCFAEQNSLIYTRYADDLSFSSDHPINSKTISSIIRIITDSGYTVNDKKTRLANKVKCQKVTGLKVNQKLNVSKKYKKELRFWIYFMSRYGLANAQKLHDQINSVKKNNVSLLVKISSKLNFFGLVRGFEDPLYMRMKCKVDSFYQKVASSKAEVRVTLNPNVASTPMPVDGKGMTIVVNGKEESSADYFMSLSQLASGDAIEVRVDGSKQSYAYFKDIVKTQLQIIFNKYKELDSEEYEKIIDQTWLNINKELRNSTVKLVSDDKFNSSDIATKQEILLNTIIELDKYTGWLTIGKDQFNSPFKNLSQFFFVPNGKKISKSVEYLGNTYEPLVLKGFIHQMVESLNQRVYVKEELGYPENEGKVTLKVSYYYIPAMDGVRNTTRSGKSANRILFNELDHTTPKQKALYDEAVNKLKDYSLSDEDRKHYQKQKKDNTPLRKSRSLKDTFIPNNPNGKNIPTFEIELSGEKVIIPEYIILGGRQTKASDKEGNRNITRNSTTTEAEIDGYIFDILNQLNPEISNNILSGISKSIKVSNPNQTTILNITVEKTQSGNRINAIPMALINNTHTVGGNVTSRASLAAIYTRLYENVKNNLDDKVGNSDKTWREVLKDISKDLYLIAKLRSDTETLTTAAEIQVEKVTLEQIEPLQSDDLEQIYTWLQSNADIIDAPININNHQYGDINSEKFNKPTDIRMTEFKILNHFIGDRSLENSKYSMHIATTSDRTSDPILIQEVAVNADLFYTDINVEKDAPVGYRSYVPGQIVISTDKSDVSSTRIDTERERIKKEIIEERTSNIGTYLFNRFKDYPITIESDIKYIKNILASIEKGIQGITNKKSAEDYVDGIALLKNLLKKNEDYFIQSGELWSVHDFTGPLSTDPKLLDFLQNLENLNLDYFEDIKYDIELLQPF